MSAVRTAGGIAAAVFAALLIWFVAVRTGPEPVVMPWAAMGGNADGAAAAVWRDRTKLLGDRKDPATISGVAVPAGEAGGEIITFSGFVSNPRQLVESWKLTQEDRAILTQPAMRVGVTSVPYSQANVLEQPQGREWRRARNLGVMYVGGWLILGVCLALSLFLFARGRIYMVEGRSGRTVERFNALERANHWMTATAFVVLALTGLVILYGKPLLLPLMGGSAFADLALFSAWLHMAAAVPLIIGIATMVVLWVRENIPSRLDWEWLRQGGGLLSETSKHPPAGKFNAGQKIVFWGVTLGGLVALASGVALMLPFFWLGYSGMQIAQLTHASVALLLIALIIGHIYIGTVGMEGAIGAMWSGKVDRNWAKEHHSLWFNALKSMPATRGSEGTSGSRPRPAG